MSGGPVRVAKVHLTALISLEAFEVLLKVAARHNGNKSRALDEILLEYGRLTGLLEHAGGSGRA